MRNLDELLHDYHDGLIDEHQLSNGLLAIDSRETTNGINSDRMIRTKLEDYIRIPRDPLDAVVEQENQKETLAIIKRITEELPEDLSLLFYYGILLGEPMECLCKRLGASPSTVYRKYDRLHEELIKYRQFFSQEVPEYTARAPKDFIRYPSEFYKSYYEGHVNRQGNYVTHCRIERYLDEVFGDHKTCCGMCDKCSNVIMRKRGES